MTASLKYLQHYSLDLQDKVRHLQAQNTLGDYITHDSRARASAFKRTQPRQSVLPIVPIYGARLPPAGV